MNERDIDTVINRFLQLKALNDVAVGLFNGNSEKFSGYNQYVLTTPYISIRHNRCSMIFSTLKYEMIQSDDEETIAFLKALLEVFKFVMDNQDDLLDDMDFVFKENVWSNLN